MKNREQILQALAAGEYDPVLVRLYVDEQLIPVQRERYSKAIGAFAERFADKEEIALYSAPGRSEVCGNHTDHQNGMVLATSINLDAIAVVAPTDNMQVVLFSDERSVEKVDLTDLTPKEDEQGTTAALIRGVAAGFLKQGFLIGGFAAYVTSDVLVGAGMSSSAAFESLLGTIFSGLYNEKKVSSVDIAKIGQYAENVYFGKPCGLMDQMACSVGGMVHIDFKEVANPYVEAVESDFEAAGISLCIVDTKGSHADLTPDYAAVPAEMKAVAQAFGKEHLREVEESLFYEKLPQLTKEVSGRAILRAIHFYSEEHRVENAVKALKEKDYAAFLQVIKQSGDSSTKNLQNIYSPKQIDSQNMSVALAITEQYIKDLGVCRVHGGGFAGTIQVFLKTEATDGYRNMIERIYGEGSCHILKVRSIGGTCVIE